MSNRLTKRSRATYIAAIPAQPPRPAYCVTTGGSIVKYVDVTSLTNAGYPAVPGYPVRIQSHQDAAGHTIIDVFQVPVVVGNTEITTCFPAIAGSPGSEGVTLTDGQQGWNSGARGVATLTGDFELSFAVPPVPSGAVICGLAPVAASIGQFAAIEHGLYTLGGLIKVYELGVEIGALGVVSTDNPVLYIQRVGGVVRYRSGSSSITSGMLSFGEKAVTAALYAAGDYIEAPATKRVFAGSSFAALSLGGDSPSSHETSFMASTVSGRDAVSGADPTIGLDGIVTVFDIAMAGVDHGIYRDFGIPSADVSPAARASEEFQSSVRFSLDEPQLSAVDTDQMLSADIVEGLLPQSADTFAPMIFATLYESLGLGDILELYVGINARLDEVLSLSDPANANLILVALLKSGLVFSDNSAQARNEAAQYATNIVTGAVTRYSGFGFSSFCRVGHDLYATRRDGLYKVGGSTDNGELLSCLVDFAADDQGSPRTKRMENIFLGITTDGRALAKLTDDTGREIKYRLIQRDSSEARIDPAKGVSSRFWRLRLEIEDVTYAEIDNIEWVAATGTRRTKR